MCFTATDYLCKVNLNHIFCVASKSNHKSNEMKKLLLVFLISTVAFAQKTKNGVIYSKHPGIELIEKFNKAFIAADTLTLDEILDDNIKLKNGLSLNKDQKGSSKNQIINSSIFWNKNVKHLSIEQDKPAYPDALEYNKGGQLWVQTWERMNGYHAESGIKIDAPLHRLFRLSPDAKKIIWIGEYFERYLYRQIYRSNHERTNGKIYIQHPNINTVRKVASAFEFGDYEVAYSYFSDNARIEDINQPVDTSFSLEQAKKNDQAFLKEFTIESIDEWGYPDYLEYEEGSSKAVLSWWKFRLIRKADGKKMVLPVHFSDSFNEEDKISRRTIYYSQSLLEK